MGTTENSAFPTIVPSTFFASNPPTLKNLGIYNAVTDYGAKGDGVTDDTAAIQAALNATPPGSTCWLPSLAAGLFYSFTSLTVPPGVVLRGSGWWWKHDVVQVAFGNAAWAVRTNYGGAVLVSTAATGNAITSTTPDTRISGRLKDLLVVGPGSGTAVGVALGAAGTASVEGLLENVGIGNFATGMTLQNVEEWNFQSLHIMGCTTGLSMATASNQNTFTMLDIQACTSALTIDSTSTGNAFFGALFQKNTGTVVSVSGNQNSFYAPWFENAGAIRALDVVAGTEIAFDRPTFANASDTIRVQAAATVTRFAGLRNHPTISNAGTASYFDGDTTNLTDTGTNTTIFDPFQGKIVFPAWFQAVTVTGANLLTIGGGTTAQRPTTGRLRGSLYYDASLAKLAIWDGASNWRDAQGTII